MVEVIIIVQCNNNKKLVEEEEEIRFKLRLNREMKTNRGNGGEREKNLKSEHKRP